MRFAFNYLRLIPFLLISFLFVDFFFRGLIRNWIFASFFFNGFKSLFLWDFMIILNFLFLVRNSLVLFLSGFLFVTFLKCFNFLYFLNFPQKANLLIILQFFFWNLRYSNPFLDCSNHVHISYELLFIESMFVLWVDEIDDFSNIGFRDFHPCDQKFFEIFSI